ncbi:MAG: hypothetical protein HRU43_05425 [Simkaniaceae bacterium]|jgi:prefoldin subunit 5|nr:hypothetical protein [Simkaniaceae bacterium]
MDKNLNNEELKARIATLESQVDHLGTEMTYLNGLLIEVGFPEGIETLKATAEELISDGEHAHQRHLKGI